MESSSKSVSKGPNMEETEKTNFCGFADNDSLKSSVQDKLARLRRIQIETQSGNTDTQTLVPPAQNKRPIMNRFLKRSESISSPSGKISPSISSPVLSSEQKQLTAPPRSTPLPPVIQKKPLPSQSLNSEVKGDANVPVARSSSLSAPKPLIDNSGNKFVGVTSTTASSSLNEGNSRPRRQSIQTPKALELEKEKQLNLTKKRAKENVTNNTDNVEIVMKKVASYIATESASVTANAEDIEETVPTLIANNIVMEEPNPSQGNGSKDADQSKPEAGNRDPDMPSLVSNNIVKALKCVLASKTPKSPPMSVEVTESKKDGSQQSANKKPPQQVSPGKRSTSISEFSFLPGQTSRSKRTIVPNKRFFSTDSPPPTPTRPTESSSSSDSCVARKPPETKPPKSPKKLKHTPAASAATTNSKGSQAVSNSHKKRSVSGDIVKTAAKASNGNRKRKLSVETLPTSTSPAANGSASTLAETSSTHSTCSSSAVVPPVEPSNGARPRRTIIPNRKFLDLEDEPMVVEPKEPAKILTEVVELKRKRRKSDKSWTLEESNSTEKISTGPQLKPPHVQGPVNTPHPSKVYINGFPPAKEKKAGAKPILPTISTLSAQKKKVTSAVLNGNSGPTTLHVVAEAEGKTEIQTKPIPSDTLYKQGVSTVNTPAPEVKVDDELPLDDSEITMCGGNLQPLFLGTCILKASVQQNQQDNGQPCSSGVICCGVCSRVKKYRTIPEKRKRGSFLCTDCVGIVSQIFNMALKAKPFSCIIGPPVCAGDCPLVFRTKDQFCQACFAKTCLRNLPMKDDVYFKVWRSIPPMSRGGVPTSPSPNSASPHVGKVAIVNDSGEIISTTGSLKMFAGLKKPNSTDAISDDSNSSNDVTIHGNGGDSDLLNSARITTFSHRSGTPTNCENAVPLKQSTGESQLPNSASCSSISTTLDTDHLKETFKPNGVKEEMLLGRQIGQERVEALAVMGAQVDPILKPDLDDIEIFGFPVIVSGPNVPRKPLCFLCGSAGIEQLIYCSFCCEPFHPYCAGDDLLLNTYIDRCKDHEEENEGGDGRTVISSKGAGLVLKWTCRRCLSCKTCGDCIGRSELIRCNRCQNAYHLDSCIDKQILSKVKDRSTLKEVWTCDVCMTCKSCGKMIEPNRRLKTMQEVAAATEESAGEDEEDDSGMEEGVVKSTRQVNNRLMLCLDCFKQRKKGSYCPLCEVCYDDNDWDSKMMECCKCNRWIHSTCENLSDEQYHILGTLPEYIEYNCRICHAGSSPPLWYDAVQSLLIKECNSAIRLFEQKCLGTMRKRSSSTDQMKPTYVCNLFGDNDGSPDSSCANDCIIIEEVNVIAKEKIPKSEDTPKVTVKIVKDHDQLDNHQRQEEKRLFRKNLIRSVSYKEMMGCTVRLIDFVKYPASLQENLRVLKILGVEILGEYDENNDAKGEEESSRSSSIQMNPSHATPKKIVFTPSKRVFGITNAVKNIVGSSMTSLRTFQKMLIRTIENISENEVEKDILLGHARNALQETFPWFDQDSLVKVEVNESTSNSVVLEETEEEEDCGKKSLLTSDPFKEMYWNTLDFFDDRVCSLCGEVGDFPPELCGRLLWCGGSEWIHCNCAIWSSEVWELDNGALQQVGSALNRGKTLRCKLCSQKGATVSCCHSSCKNNYHFKCAIDANCFLLENKKQMFCSHHQLTPKQLDDIQEDMKVGRKVFVDLDWIHKRGIKAYSSDTKIFIGSLRINSLGRIVPISVTRKEWAESPSETLIIPLGFHSQRIFWSMDDPWQKDCYSFQTIVSSNGFPHRRVQDVGVNLVVDHSKKKEIILQRLCTIRKFHQRISNAPRYIDEQRVEWLSACSEEFHISDDENESGIESFEGMRNHQAMLMGRSSPSSVSSFGSVNPRNNRRSPYPLRKMHTEVVDTEGYASSVESNLNETPKSSRVTRQTKRRRSSCKSSSRRTPRKRFKPTQTYESPRRRSLRNLRSRDAANSNWEKSICYQQKEEIESDADSGMIEGSGSSTMGNGDEDRIHCRVNLLALLNASSAEEDSSQIDTISVVSSVEQEAGTVNSQVMEEIPPFQISEGEAKVYTASICFQVKRNHDIICDSCDARQAWIFLFDKVSKTRRNHKLKELVHPTINANLSGSNLEQANSFRTLGISHRSTQYLFEQLPEIHCVVDRHKFCYSHRPYVDPNDENALVKQNVTGSARTEGFSARKPFDMFGWLASRHRKVHMSCDIPEDSSRSQGLPLAMQFRDLKVKARKRFVVLHSEIHGRGLFARADVEKGEMLIEYAGEVIRPSLSDPRERYYESRGIGCYMFRIKTQVIDATLKGNAARFINHSCEPNCEAKTIRILGKDHIIIFALRKIFKGEELTYDYKFEREENKIPCSCGAARCRKYMN